MPAQRLNEVNGFGNKINIMAGGRQGGRDAPKLWNVLLFLILRDVVEEWEEEQLVWELPTRDDLRPRLNTLAWADDLLIFANSKEGLQKKTQGWLRD